MPSAASAANDSVSDNVGCGCTVRPDVLRVAAHLDRERGLGDQVAGVRADDAGAEHAARRLVEQQLREAVRAAERQRAGARDPRERALLVLDAARFRVVLGEAHPRDLGIGVRDGRHDARVEEALLPRGDFRRDLAFVARFVREHRLADDVADREDVRHVRPHLLVDADQAALVHLDAGALRRDPPAVRAAPHRDEHEPVDLRAVGRVVAFEMHGDARGARLHPHDLRAEHDLLVARRDPLLERLHEIAVAARESASW